MASRIPSDVVTALAPLTGLAGLAVWPPEEAVVPAALAQLTGLRLLEFSGLNHTVFEPGCLDLPGLVSLDFRECHFYREKVPPGVPALPSLTRICFGACSIGLRVRDKGPEEFSYQLVRLPWLQRMVSETGELCRDWARLWVSRLPADMGALSSALVRISISKHKRKRKLFLLGPMQPVALKPLNASGSVFAEVPAAVTALSMLTELPLGRAVSC